MKALILRTALWCLLLAAPLVQAAQSAPVLLWLTSDITTAPRTAMVQRLAAEAGLGFAHIDYPLGGPAVLDAAQAQKLERALAGAALVWVDAPHASVEARLRRMVGAQLDARAARAPGRVVWVPAGTPAVDLSALEAPARMVAYLQAGGPRNLKNAIALARATVAGAAMPALPAPDILPPRGLYHPDAPRLLPNAAALEAWRQGQPALRGLPAVAVLVHRHHFVDGSTEWLDAWLHTFRQEGLFAYAAFGQRYAQALVAAALGHSPATPRGGVEAEIVRFSTFEDLQAAPEAAVRGFEGCGLKATATNTVSAMILRAIPGSGRPTQAPRTVAGSISAAAISRGMRRYDSRAGAGPMQTSSSAKRTWSDSRSASE